MMRKTFTTTLIILMVVCLAANNQRIIAQQFADVIPPWLIGHENVLPPVSPEIKHEVRQLWKKMLDNSPDLELGERKLHAEYVRPAEKFISLGEVVGQVLVWDYLEEPETLDLSQIEIEERPAHISSMVSQNGQVKDRLLTRLGHDPTLEKWILPMLRVRMEWFENAIAEGHINEVISSTEMGGIGGYLYSHGDRADLEKYYHLINGLRKANFEPSLFKNHPTLESQAADIAESRKNYQNAKRTVADDQRSFLKSLGVVINAAPSKGQTGSADGSVSPAVRSSSQKSTDAKSEKNIEVGSRSWLLWVLTIIVAVGGIIFMIRKPNR